MDLDTLHSSHTLIASDRVEGTPVRRSNGDKIGTIQRLMVDKATGTVAYAVLTFGGFFGVGRHHMPVPWALLHYDPQAGAYRLDMTDMELDRARAEADEFDWGERTQDVTIAPYRRLPPNWGSY